MHITLQGLLYPAARVDVVHVGVDDDFQQHLRMIGATSAIIIQFAERAQV